METDLTIQHPARVVNVLIERHSRHLQRTGALRSSFGKSR